MADGSCASPVVAVYRQFPGGLLCMELENGSFLAVGTRGGHVLLHTQRPGRLQPCDAADPLRAACGTGVAALFRTETEILLLLRSGAAIHARLEHDYTAASTCFPGYVAAYLAPAQVETARCRVTAEHQVRLAVPVPRPPVQQRHAYLILAHSRFDQLSLLLHLLDDPRNDIYIHVDRKARRVPFERLAAATIHARVQFTGRRLCVRWGGPTLGLAEMQLFETAVAAGPYARYHLLSGMDLPLYSQEAIHRFFAAPEHHGAAFLFHYAVPESSSMYERMSLYHVHALRGFSRPLLALQRKLGVNRIKDRYPRCAVGENWCSLPHNIAQYLVDHLPEIRRISPNTRNSDEMYKPMLLLNSPLSHLLFRSPQGESTTLWFKIWPEGARSPRVFTSADFTQLAAAPSHFLFARKFDMEREPVVVHRTAALAEARA